MDVLLAVLVTAIVAADIADTALLGAVVTVMLAPSREHCWVQLSQQKHLQCLLNLSNQSFAFWGCPIPLQTLNRHLAIAEERSIKLGRLLKF